MWAIRSRSLQCSWNSYKNSRFCYFIRRIRTIIDWRKSSSSGVGKGFVILSWLKNIYQYQKTITSREIKLWPSVNHYNKKDDIHLKDNALRLQNSEIINTFRQVFPCSTNRKQTHLRNKNIFNICSYSKDEKCIHFQIAT